MKLAYLKKKEGRILILNAIDSEIPVGSFECFECGQEIEGHCLFCDDVCREFFLDRNKKKSIAMMWGIYDIKQVRYWCGDDAVSEYLTLTGLRI